MNLKIIFFVTCLIVFPTCLLAEENNEIPPIQNNWDKESDGNRSFSSSPSLFKDTNSVYVYSEKQLDNVTIGITDMQGNTFHYEVTTIPACTYYAVSIESLPSGQYYLCVYQGSNYVIGIFQK